MRRLVALKLDKNAHIMDEFVPRRAGDRKGFDFVDRHRIDQAPISADETMGKG
jgi:hypothetical protein